MRKISLIAFTLFLMVGSMNAQSIVGVWKTIDDETNVEKSYVTISEKDGVFYGHITELLVEEDKGKVCEDCPGDKKNAEIVGLEILWGLTAIKDYWGGGKILDPNNGKTYKSYVELQGEDKLKVRGYIGVAALGRTQYWHRVK